MGFFVVIDLSLFVGFLASFMGVFGVVVHLLSHTVIHYNGLKAPTFAWATLSVTLWTFVTSIFWCNHYVQSTFRCRQSLCWGGSAGSIRDVEKVFFDAILGFFDKFFPKKNEISCTMCPIDIMVAQLSAATSLKVGFC